MMGHSARKLVGAVLGLLALGAAGTAGASSAGTSYADVETAFDRTFSPEQRSAPITSVQPYRSPVYTPSVYQDSFQARLVQIADAAQGRIGVAAVDLTTGRSVSVLGDQPFPMASTSKVAVAATFLEMVDNGQLKLSDQFPLMVPVPSRKYDGPVAPVRRGTLISGQGLMELALTRSDNQATDALLAAIGGPGAVNSFLRRAGITGLRMDRDIATLVRDDGEYNPATTIDPRDSGTPKGMVELLSGLHQGRWLSPSSRSLLIDTMSRCVTGKRRIPLLMPTGVSIAHKTGTLNNTASDVGLITTPDGRTIALAIYVTGQGGKPARDARIAEIARTVYDGYLYENLRNRGSLSR